MTTVLLLRHGEPDAAVLGTHYGQIDAPLSETGRAQSEALAERLRSTRVDRVVSSDLQRAIWLADRIARPRDLEVARVEALRERHLGVFQGLTYEEGFALDPEFAAEMQQNPGLERPGDGESLRDLAARVIPAIEALVADAPGERVVVACHGGPIRVVLGDVLGVPFDRLPRIALDYCGVTTIEYRPRGPKVRGVNE